MHDNVFQSTISLLAAAALLSACAASAAQGTAPGASLALTHVTVVDVAGGALQSDMTVVIAGSRISAISRSATTPPPAGAPVIDATGKYMIPGLWDMHVHLFTTRPTSEPTTATGTSRSSSPTG